MDIRECIETLKLMRTEENSTIWGATTALDLAIQTLQDVADGKLIKPMERVEIITAMDKPWIDKKNYDDGIGARLTSEEIDDIADALQGRV